MPHPIVTDLYQQLTLPVFGAPMFIVSRPELVIAQCASGIVGSMPALNARPQHMLSPWLTQIETSLSDLREREPGRLVAPYAVNLIIHHSNERVDADLEVCARHKVPIIITSLRAPDRVVDEVHAWGGKVFHDVTTLRHAEKALEAGVDGLVLVCAGAGGHAGTLNPFALLGEVRRIFDGPVALSGAISRGHDIAAARAMGADFAYMGTRFIASQEASAHVDYKKMVLQSTAKDVLYTPYFSGIPGNYLKHSIAAAGLDPDALPDRAPGPEGVGTGRSKAWIDIWGAGQGVGNIDSIQSVAEIVEDLQCGYQAACQAMHDRFSMVHT